MTSIRKRLLSASIQALTGGAMMALYVGPVLAADRGDDTQKLEAIEVTGSRIKRAEVEGQTPVITITAKDIEATGLASVGDILQRLSVSGSSLNTKFNSAGNFGFPPDGGGVGSGSTTVSLRNLGAKRTLVLVDGLRWVSESSASGVSAAVDINTIPASVVERIEILTDGASSLYGSDAVAGVINIITKKKQDGAGINLYYGDYSKGDGQTTNGDVSIGGSGDRYSFFIDISNYKQHAISSDVTEQSRFPVPGTGVALGSSRIPTTRTSFFLTGTNTFGGLCAPADRNGDGVNESVFCKIAGNGTAPGGVPNFPNGFHQFTGADAFNFAPYNLLLTPSERTGIFANASYKISDNINWYVKGLYNTRKSKNQAAPEPIDIGANAVGIGSTISVDVTNPYNPFGRTLGAADGLDARRRPLEGGPRIFSQDVDTKYVATGLEGTFNWGERTFSWDVNYVNGDNKAAQSVTGTYNIQHIKNALGPVANCVAPCVPLNYFGGPGTITPEMLSYILFNEQDRSDEKLEMATANISGNLFQLPAGSLDFAAGYEHRHQTGSYSPDSIVIAGESNGVPSLPTSGDFSIDEYYLELNAPILADVPGFKHLDLSVASRYSDYSTFGGTTNNKFGLRWQVFDDLTFRGTYAEGFRAPSIGELNGAPARFDSAIVDPCSAATNAGTIANCRTLGTPVGFVQADPQIPVITGGSTTLQPETSKSTTVGAVYSPSWAENNSWSQKMDFTATYFKIKVKGAIQAPDAQTLINRCVATLDPQFCDLITRNSQGDATINGALQNLGKIDTDGYDLGFNWIFPDTSVGRFSAGLQSTYTHKYTAVATDSGLAEPRAVGVEVLDSSIPKWRTSFNLGWTFAAWSAGYTARYTSALQENCGDAVDFPVCGNQAEGTNKLAATTYHDIRLSWKVPVDFNFVLSAGVNNVTDKSPPICLSCTLNGYDASAYDIPGRFSYVSASIKF
jgi:iron complex outermembrane recepter protein